MEANMKTLLLMLVATVLAAPTLASAQYLVRKAVTQSSHLGNRQLL
jgi:cell division protein FtsL